MRQDKKIEELLDGLRLGHDALATMRLEFNALLALIQRTCEQLEAQGNHQAAMDLSDGRDAIIDRVRAALYPPDKDGQH